MTYDERQEIEDYIKIVESNTKRLERSIDMLKTKLNAYKCEPSKPIITIQTSNQIESLGGIRQ